MTQKSPSATPPMPPPQGPAWAGLRQLTAFLLALPLGCAWGIAFIPAYVLGAAWRLSLDAVDVDAYWNPLGRFLRAIRGPKAKGNSDEESAGTSKSTHGNE